MLPTLAIAIEGDVTASQFGCLLLPQGSQICHLLSKWGNPIKLFTTMELH
jgi:hypothetical protein